MTISYEAFEKVLDKDCIRGLWNSDGTILIIRHLKNYKPFQEGSNYRSINLKPEEIKTILEKDKFQYEGVRPGLIPTYEKIEVNVIDGIVEIKSTFSPVQDLPTMDNDPLLLPKTILKEIYDHGIEGPGLAI